MYDDLKPRHGGLQSQRKVIRGEVMDIRIRKGTVVVVEPAKGRQVSSLTLEFNL